MLSYREARQRVIETASSRFSPQNSLTGIESIDIAENPAAALGRVLAVDVHADRNYPPFPRAIRDGFAVRAQDLQPAGQSGAESAPGSRTLTLLGESKAGTAFSGTVRAGQCVRIMTGAPVPSGSDAVVMVEYTVTNGDQITFQRAPRSGEYIVPAGSEAQERQVVVRRASRLGFAELAMAAQVGQTKLQLTRRPRAAILSTGDEVVMANQTPGPYQIRNSNSVSLAAQASLAGAEPIQLGNSPDTAEALREYIERGLQEDLLIISGGVSAGKYDLVEGVLADLGAQFLFDSIAIRPGRPAVFGICRDKLVFGLPGNPVSTMVTFELLVLPAIDILSGTQPRQLPLFKAAIKHDLNEKPDLAHFLPARVGFSASAASVEVLPWQGSGDVAAVAESNCFVVVDQNAGFIKAGQLVEILPRRGLL
jgi:molybdopterin molybdotransferase